MLHSTARITRIYVIARRKVSNLIKKFPPKQSCNRSLVRLLRGVPFDSLKKFKSRSGFWKEFEKRHSSKLAKPHFCELPIIQDNDVKIENHKTFLFPFSFSLFTPSRPAMTLAEVLITLGIIGIIAAMTIPNLIASYQKQQTVVQLKKAYTNLAQAVKQSEVDNGPNQYWDWGDSITRRQSFDTYFAPYLRILRYCTSITGCGYPSGSTIKTRSGAEFLGIADTSRTTVNLSDGSILILRYIKGGGYGDKFIAIDINAGKGPNMMGKDTFIFNFDSKKGLVIYGYNVAPTAVTSNCAANNDGTMCAAKIMRDGWQIKDDYPW